MEGPQGGGGRWGGWLWGDGGVGGGGHPNCKSVVSAISPEANNHILG